MRQPRGLRGSEMHLMAPPLPAASRPLHSTTSLLPAARTQYCIFTSSMCSSSSLASYSLRFSLPFCADWLSSASLSAFFFFLLMGLFLTLDDLGERLPGLLIPRNHSILSCAIPLQDPAA